MRYHQNGRELGLPTLRKGNETKDECSMELRKDSLLQVSYDSLNIEHMIPHVIVLYCNALL